MNDHWLGRIAPVLHHAGFVRMGNGVINPWRMIDDHELFMFDNGAAKMVVGEREFTYDSPWFIVVPPATRHISYCLSEAVDIYYCHFNWEYSEESGLPVTVYDETAERFRRTTPAPGYVPPCPLHGTMPTRSTLETHHRVVAAFSSATVHEQLGARAMFLGELVDLLAPRAESRGRVVSARIDAERVRQALTELAQRPFAEAPSVKDTIAGLGSSYYHLERVFRQRFGVSPQQYVSLVRVERAKELLHSSADTVVACARALGYHDVGYFIRFFRKQTGASPGVFRRTGTR